MENDLLRAVMVLIPLVLSLSVHEYCHAAAAYLLKDDTAARMGRLTLNPIAHIDPVGTIILPLMGVMFGGFIFGWAKPVPVQPMNFTRKVSMRKGMLLVSAAGPASNLAMALIGSLLAFVFYKLQVTAEAPWTMLRIFIQLNIILAFFNLIPVPPLDGSKILAGILPYKYANFIDTLEKYGFMILIFLLFSGALKVLFYPANLLANFLFTWPAYF